MKTEAGFSDCNSEVTKFMFARVERLPRAIYDMKCCMQSLHRLSIPFGPFCICRAPLWHVVCFSHVVRAMKYFGGYMTKIIEFYIPQSFRKVSKWFPPAERGKVLAFPLAARKSA
jgi:hypothetical protein